MITKTEQNKTKQNKIKEPFSSSHFYFLTELNKWDSKGNLIKVLIELFENIHSKTIYFKTFAHLKYSERNQLRIM